MKSMKTCLLWLFMLLALTLSGQQKTLPYAELYTLEGNRTDTRVISNDSMPLIMVMWKTYELDCCENLFSICDIWKEKLESKGVKMVAICTDCIGQVSHIKPFVFGHNIDAQVYIDKNGDFRRKMGISDGPFTILFDRDMNVYCEYSGYCTGIDEALCEKVNRCLEGIALTEAR